MQKSKENKFNSISVGDNARIIHTITGDDLKKFVELTGDDNKLHVDSEFARKTAYKNPVVHGMLGASFISTIIGTKIPGDGALWFSQNLEFLLPVRIGDVLSILAEVIAKHEKDQIIELKTDIYNQKKQLVTTGKAKVKIIEEEPQLQEEKQEIKKTALIIGATGGIGSSVCLQLASDGFDIAIHHLADPQNAALLQEKIIKSGRKAIAIHADIREEDQVGEMIETVRRKLGSIYVLVFCASPLTPAIKFHDLSYDDFQKQLDVNLKGLFYLAKSVIPVMEEQGSGKIINISSQYSESTPPAELAPYVTAKCALNGFSKSLAVELAPKNITVNLVSPGMTDTGFIADVPAKTKLLTAAKTPLRRIARPSDISGVIGFLASEKADYLTGETIRVNGGQIML
jgi:3-oxoacyl-[acyl-carrier protein] reductase